MPTKYSSMLAKSIGAKLRKQLRTSNFAHLLRGKFVYTVYKESRYYITCTTASPEGHFLRHPSITTTSQLHSEPPWFDAAVQRVMDRAEEWTRTAAAINVVARCLDSESLDVFTDFLEEHGISDMYDEMSRSEMEFVLKEITKYAPVTS